MSTESTSLSDTKRSTPKLPVGSLRSKKCAENAYGDDLRKLSHICARTLSGGYSGAGQKAFSHPFENGDMGADL
jgi:hypothetical protein